MAQTLRLYQIVTGENVLPCTTCYCPCSNILCIKFQFLFFRNMLSTTFSVTLAPLALLAQKYTGLLLIGDQGSSFGPEISCFRWFPRSARETFLIQLRAPQIHALGWENLGVRNETCSVYMLAVKLRSIYRTKRKDAWGRTVHHLPGHHCGTDRILAI